MSPRDTQRAKVYDAEHLVRGAFDRADAHGNRTIEVYGSQLTLPIERRFASVDSVQNYVDRVLDLNWVGMQWDRAAVPVRVRARAGAAAAHYEAAAAVLAVPLHRRGTAWALRELVVLHELAHHLEPAAASVAPPIGRGRPKCVTSPAPGRAEARQPHGPEFCTRYVELVDGVIGPEAALLLRATMLGCDIRFG